MDATTRISQKTNRPGALIYPQFHKVIHMTDDKKYYCPLCGGDGKETCNNPDHGFISHVGQAGDKDYAMEAYEVGRLGCPGCGHDPNHKVPNGGSCELCEGTGQVDEATGLKYLSDCRIDNELEEIQP